ncbi:N(2)-fixation sustaining protein CowN [Vibrio aerogenes CECT 7868]|uniref:N(2)-fixation sustaining protein CowN n=1 Tax=Vibrio aerogenes CECT 7868 TaxID=1216006 RepID=A0A1M5ZR68_9VIBR|nr:N(2)-fixation sustaining protein CowN [Vibrio aerogenes]SHI26845.1 N(2)-fixation sustaining protein CowN [Vibrio aerogenes CECT 7868]
MTAPETDRYISFCNIDCDKNADQLIQMLNEHLQASHGGEKWLQYFHHKLEEQQQRAHDNLHFIGNQLNMLYKYFEECRDEQASALLYQIEQECC